MPPSLPGVPTRGLIIRQPWIAHILAGRKSWELRGRATTLREPVALIEGGTGRIVGLATITDSIGPLDRPARVAAARRGDILPEEVDEAIYLDVHAWAFADVQRLVTPVPYQHPSGAVIWVTLAPETRQALARGMRRTVPAPRAGARRATARRGR